MARNNIKAIVDVLAGRGFSDAAVTLEPVAVLEDGSRQVRVVVHGTQIVTLAADKCAKAGRAGKAGRLRWDDKSKRQDAVNAALKVKA